MVGDDAVLDKRPRGMVSDLSSPVAVSVVLIFQLRRTLIVSRYSFFVSMAVVCRHFVLTQLARQIRCRFCYAARVIVVKQQSAPFPIRKLGT